MRNLNLQGSATKNIYDKTIFVNNSKHKIEGNVLKIE